MFSNDNQITRTHINQFRINHVCEKQGKRIKPKRIKQKIKIIV